MLKKNKQFAFKSFDALLKHLVVPKGFTLKSKTVTEPYSKHGKKGLEISITNPSFCETEITMDCRIEKESKWSGRKKVYTGKKFVEFNGHTNFVIDGHSYSYDAYGVSDSFYSNGDEDPNTTILEQIEKIKESVEFHKTALIVPQINRSISPERYKQAKVDLKAGKAFTSTTAGFGVWYTIAKQHMKYSERATDELEKFFGVSPLYVNAQDMD